MRSPEKIMLDLETNYYKHGKLPPQGSSDSYCHYKYWRASRGMYVGWQEKMRLLYPSVEPGARRAVRGFKDLQSMMPTNVSIVPGQTWRGTTGIYKFLDSELGEFKSSPKYLIEEHWSLGSSGFHTKVSKERCIKAAATIINNHEWAQSAESRAARRYGWIKECAEVRAKTEIERRIVSDLQISEAPTPKSDMSDAGNHSILDLSTKVTLLKTRGVKLEIIKDALIMDGHSKETIDKVCGSSNLDLLIKSSLVEEIVSVLPSPAVKYAQRKISIRLDDRPKIKQHRKEFKRALRNYIRRSHGTLTNFYKVLGGNPTNIDTMLSDWVVPSMVSLSKIKAALNIDSIEVQIMTEENSNECV